MIRTTDLRWFSKTVSYTEPKTRNGSKILGGGTVQATKEVKVLQQKWISKDGTVKWVDIPTVKE